MSVEEIQYADNDRGLSAEMQHAASMLELSGVYNRHADAHDAKLSADLVAPDTIAYTEGVQIEPDNDRTGLGSVLEDLARYKRENGKGRMYYKIRDSILKEIGGRPSFTERLKGVFRHEDPNQEKRASGEFLEHDRELTIQLLEKNCDIISADYSHIVGAPNPEAFTIASEAIKTMMAETGYTIMNKVVATNDADKFVANLKAMLMRRHVVQGMRENAAALHAIYDARDILSRPQWYDQVEKTDDGKIRGSILYGTGHAYTLTEALRNKGISVEPHIVRPAEAWKYLDVSWNMQEGTLHAPNFYQQLTHAAYRALAISIKSRHPQRIIGGQAEIVSNEVYPLLEVMIGREADALDFSKRCLAVRQKLNADPDAAFGDFLQMADELRGANPALAQQ